MRMLAKDVPDSKATHLTITEPKIAVEGFAGSKNVAPLNEHIMALASVYPSPHKEQIESKIRITTILKKIVNIIHPNDHLYISF